eukprot:snap_masked-scaffold_51-processed-gene-0.26-mRNA-1 protein AED:1.00 eAED:1.00 QI:0/0/0/0/1/1/2/0/75
MPTVEARTWHAGNCMGHTVRAVQQNGTLVKTLVRKVFFEVAKSNRTKILGGKQLDENARKPMCFLRAFAQLNWRD